MAQRPPRRTRLAAVRWAWTGYAWLTSTLDVDEGAVRLAMLAATAAMLRLLRVAPTELLGAALLVTAGFLAGDIRIAAWILALAIDYVGPAVVALHGWRIAREHFAERYGLVVLIALGESIIAIGVGAGLHLTTEVIVGAALDVTVISALWWLYFDVAAIFARRQLIQAVGVAQIRLARDAYSYLHLPMVAGSACALVLAYEAIRY